MIYYVLICKILELKKGFFHTTISRKVGSCIIFDIFVSLSDAAIHRFLSNTSYRQRVLVSQVLDETLSAVQREALHSRRGGCSVQMSHNGVPLMKGSQTPDKAHPCTVQHELTIPDDPPFITRIQQRWGSTSECWRGTVVMTCCILSTYLVQQWQWWCGRASWPSVVCSILGLEV